MSATYKENQCQIRNALNCTKYLRANAEVAFALADCDMSGAIVPGSAVKIIAKMAEFTAPNPTLKYNDKDGLIKGESLGHSHVRSVEDFVGVTGSDYDYTNDNTFYLVFDKIIKYLANVEGNTPPLADVNIVLQAIIELDDQLKQIACNLGC
jgi:hypothetical protein